MSGAPNGGTWLRLVRATVSLAAAWAEFKLALDAHGSANQDNAISHKGQRS